MKWADKIVSRHKAAGLPLPIPEGESEQGARIMSLNIDVALCDRHIGLTLLNSPA